MYATKHHEQGTIRLVVMITGIALNSLQAGTLLLSAASVQQCSMPGGMRRASEMVETSGSGCM